MADENGKQDGEDAGEAPEVEAELVVDPQAATEAFDDDAEKAAPPEEAADDSAATNTPEKPPLLTPGVILFLAFGFVALVALGVWRFQPHAKSADEAASPVNEENAPPKQSAPDDLPAAMETKVANTPVDHDKRPPAPMGTTGDSYLPPVSEGGADKIANTVEAGAKEAMRRFEEADGAATPEEAVDTPPSDAPLVDTQTEDTPPTDEITGFDIAGEGLTVIDEAGEAATSLVTGADNTPDTKIANTDGAAGTALKAEMKALREEFEQERTRLAAELALAQQANENQSTEIDSLRSQLQAATEREGALQDDVDEMRAEYQKVRNNDLNHAARQMKASFALAALSRAVAAGGPFEQELAAVAEFEPTARAMLEAHAREGVATEANLRENFDAAARAALSAARLEKASGPWSKLGARLQSVISVRPARPTTGDEPGQVLSRAENALNEGEIGFALLQLEDLPLSAQEAMGDWIADARARAETDAALHSLQARLSGETG